MNHKKETIKKKYSRLLNQLLEEYKTKKDVKGIYLFGSLAKGKAKEGSDIDLEIIFKKRKPSYELIHTWKEGIKIDLSIYNLKEFTNDFSNNPQIMYSALNYKILYDPEGLLKENLPKITQFFKKNQKILSFWKEKEKKWKKAKKEGKKENAQTYFEVAEEAKKTIQKLITDNFKSFINVAMLNFYWLQK